MSQRREGPHREGRGRSARGSRARLLLAIPILWIVAVAVIDSLAPSDIHLGPLLVAAPAITASFAGPWTVGLVAALAVISQTVIGLVRDPDELLSANHEAQVISLVLVGVLLVIFCVLRERRAKELAQVRYVSESAQRVVLPPLPKRLGPLRVASLYLAAEAEAQIGGDLYAVARTPSGTRLIVGDVRGKGMTAVNDASLLLGAFRVAAHRQSSLGELVSYLDRSVCWDLTEPGEANRYGETFITATVLDIPDQGGRVEMVACGHPPPVVLRDGRPTTMDVLHPAPPLGLGELAHPRYHVDSFPFEPGSLLLLYTDGVTEARDATGTFYPLAERITGWAERDADAFLGRLRRDLMDWVGGQLGDDAAMIVLERPAAPPA
ncbi:PP2C family protein-serine/threonine phosphatase [Streptomyces sp. NPDC001493]